MSNVFTLYLLQESRLHQGQLATSCLRVFVSDPLQGRGQLIFTSCLFSFIRTSCMSTSLFVFSTNFIPFCRLPLQEKTVGLMIRVEVESMQHQAFTPLYPQSKFNLHCRPQSEFNLRRLNCLDVCLYVFTHHVKAFNTFQK